MVAQCLAAAISLFALYHGTPLPEALEWAVMISIWVAVLMTIYSGGIYVHRAIGLLRG